MDAAARWAEYERHPGDRSAMFLAVRNHLEPRRVLYPGSYIDIAASMVFDDVTYVDVDRRAARFFADPEGVDALISGHRELGGDWTWEFLAADFTESLPLEEGSFDLLVSLYAGGITENCGRYLADGGRLVANTSHGDVALAAEDPQFHLEAVIDGRDGRYEVSTEGLGERLIPKPRRVPTPSEIRTSTRGVAYTKPAAAYVFRRG